MKRNNKTIPRWKGILSNELLPIIPEIFHSVYVDNAGKWEYEANYSKKFKWIASQLKVIINEYIDNQAESTATLFGTLNYDLFDDDDSDKTQWEL